MQAGRGTLRPLRPAPARLAGPLQRGLAVAPGLLGPGQAEHAKYTGGNKSPPSLLPWRLEAAHRMMTSFGCGFSGETSQNGAPLRLPWSVALAPSLGHHRCAGAQKVRRKGFNVVYHCA